MEHMEKEHIAEILARIRQRRPLVYSIANMVTACDCANATLAVGASPVMGLEEEEVRDIVGMAGAVVLNIGTATCRTAQLMETAAGYAAGKGIPVILDPVGAGASRFRTDLSIRLIEKAHPIIRCNYSEFLTLAGIRSETRGVDSVQNDFFDCGVISSLASALGTVIAVTGKNDVISDGHRTAVIHNGSPRMEDISGTGCICSSLAGAAAAVAGSREETASCITAAIALMGVCGEKAGMDFTGTSSMKTRIIDNLSTMDTGEFLSRLRMTVR